MTIDEWLRAKILSICHEEIDNRCYPGVQPKDTELPCVIYLDISFEKELFLRGPVKSIITLGETKQETEKIGEMLYKFFDEFVDEKADDLEIEEIEIYNSITILTSTWRKIIDIEIQYIRR